MKGPGAHHTSTPTGLHGIQECVLRRQQRTTNPTLEYAMKAMKLLHRFQMHRTPFKPTFIMVNIAPRHLPSLTIGYASFFSDLPS